MGEGSTEIARKWVTPLVGGMFVLMALTGIAMFFHVGTPIGHVVHEWLGWAFVVIVVLHLAANQTMFQAHLKNRTARIIATIFAVVVLVALAPLGGGNRREDTVRRVVDGVANAQLTTLAPLTGRDVEILATELRNAGFSHATPSSTCKELAGEERSELFRALAIVFPPSEPRS